jgi:hypothetical protein
MNTAELLPVVHLAISAVFLVWNILLAGRITRQRALPPLLSWLTALGGLLIAPALIVLVASTSLVTGRSVSTIGWIWPVTATLIAGQAFYATAARMVTPLIGIPIVLYNLVAAATSLAGYLVAEGDLTRGPLLTLLAASASAISITAGSASAVSPLHVSIPLLSPAHPSRWRIVAGWRVVIGAVAAAWVVLVAVELRRGSAALTGYQRFENAELRPRPDEAFAVGLEILPTLSGPPLAFALRNDLELVGNGELDAVLVTIASGGASTLALDSLRRALEPYRRDSLLLIAGLAPSDAPREEAMSSRRDSAYLEVVDRIARRLRPDYLVALEEPRGVDTRPRGAMAPGRRQWQIRAMTAAVKRVDRRIKVGISVIPGLRDSALYAWAASSDSPLDAVGFTLVASAGGGPRLDARIRTADAWMQRAGTAKEHWLFRAGGAPSIHGDAAQELAMAGLLSWSMGRAGMRGAIVTHAGDYGSMRGLRAASGRLRPATSTLFRAAKEAESR